jgi:shikimate kinase
VTEPGAVDSPCSPYLRVLLVGFMGSGKSSVGHRLAQLLGWAFRDFDEEIQSGVGLSIPDIFRQHGEEFFRSREERVGTDLLQMREVVLASGGGWPAKEGRMNSLDPATISVWLKVSPEVAVERARREGATRPLLEVNEPLVRARDLIREREPFYRQAHFTIDSCAAGPDELAQRIHDLIYEKGEDHVRSLPPYK